MAVVKQNHQKMVKALVFRRGRRDLSHAVCFFIMRRTRGRARGIYCIDKSLCKYLIACSLSQLWSFTAAHCHTRNSVLL